MLDLRARHFLTLAGASHGPELAVPELDSLWSTLTDRAARGDLPADKLERARGGYELLRQRAGRRARSGAPEKALVRSRVLDSRTGRYTPVALLPDLSVWSSSPGFELLLDEVASTVSAGVNWEGRGAAELAALVREIGARITPNVGLVARDMGPWLDLYIAYETHSVTLRAIREHFRRTAHPDLDLLYQTIAQCDGRRDLDRDELLDCTRFVLVDSPISEGVLVGDDDHWRVPVSRAWRKTVLEEGPAIIDGCFVVARDETGPLLVRRAGGERFVIGR